MGESSFGVLENSPVFSASYRSASQALFHKYHPIEMDATIPREEKMEKMEEWWRAAEAAIVSQRMTRSEIRTAAGAGRFKIREGVRELFALCGRLTIPLLIFSAGIGDVIDAVLEKEGLASLLHGQSVHVISNYLRFAGEDQRPESSGVCVGFKDNIIHVLNKNIAAINDPQHSHIITAIRSRRNALVIGDHIGDSGMIDELTSQSDPSNPFPAFKIGLLNADFNNPHSIAAYSRAFDLVLVDDPPLHPVVSIIEKAFESKHR